MQTAQVTIDGISATPYKVEWNFMMQRPSPVQPPDSSMRLAAGGPPPDKIIFESDGAQERQIKNTLALAGLPTSGQAVLFDGRSRTSRTTDHGASRWRRSS